MTIHATDGRSFASTVFLPHGSAALGIDWADIEAKYRTLMPNSRLSGERIEQSFAVIRDFKTARGTGEKNARGTGELIAQIAAPA